MKIWKYCLIISVKNEFFVFSTFNIFPFLNDGWLNLENHLIISSLQNFVEQNKSQQVSQIISNEFSSVIWWASNWNILDGRNYFWYQTLHVCRRWNTPSLLEMDYDFSLSCVRVKKKLQDTYKERAND